MDYKDKVLNLTHNADKKALFEEPLSAMQKEHYYVPHVKKVERITVGDPLLQRVQVALGGEAVAANTLEKTHEEAVEAWVSRSIRLRGKDGGGWNAACREFKVGSLDDPFLLENREDIIMRAMTAYRGQSNSLLVDLIATLTEDEGVSLEMIDSLVLANPNLVLSNPNIFPNFRFKMLHIESITAAARLQNLMRNWELIEPDCLQFFVDFVIENLPICMGGFKTALPAGISLTEPQVVKMASEASLILFNIFTYGSLLEYRSNKAVLQAMTNAGFYNLTMKAISDELLSTIDFAELKVLLGHHIFVEMAARLLALGRLDTDEDIYRFIEHADSLTVSRYAKDLPLRIQSACFKDMVSKPNDYHQWVSYVGRFTKLRDEDYAFLIDNISAFLSKDIEHNVVMGLFDDVTGEIKVRYENEILPILARVKEEQRQREIRNTNREMRRAIEEDYFNFGNIVPVTYSHNETIGDNDIVNAFENEHCVRTIGLLQDIANDQSRTNVINGLESPSLHKTGQLGAGVPEADRIARTEHEALQELVGYLDKHSKDKPGSPLFETLANQLSFVGEKEYAEAVKGIATYWKWFLDQDSDNQLYVDAVVTADDTTMKSDIYMFDRILEHFSDEDMEKYWGRLLTKGAEIIQNDPSKVKVVLLDDWTISGAQLRSGYSRFVGAHTGLASSVEVQLIAASAERITMGIEGLMHAAEGHLYSQEKHVPIVTRAYYLAHRADTMDSEAKGSRITGSHSSVDFGFSNDLQAVAMDDDDNFPLLVNVIRSYRQTDYRPMNVRRLRRIYGIEDRVKNIRRR